MPSPIQEKFNHIPAMHQILHDPEILSVAGMMPRYLLKKFLQESLQRFRSEIQATTCKNLQTFLINDLKRLLQPQQSPVINATGVFLHTNLGRAPLPSGALRHLSDVVSHYHNLEFDLVTAERGGRDAHPRQLLRLLTGAEEALIVNNNAAAVHLILNALCLEKEAIISRGELIEIGDGFRLHEIISASGARLCEIGSTNRTHLRDYKEAVEKKAAGLIFKAHSSNFKIVGFTESPAINEIVALAQQYQLPVAYDLGSTALVPNESQPPALQQALAAEITASELIAAGVDLVCFSGDKLVGGPQAGIIVGKKAYIARLRRHPLYRALRLDKMNLALLDWTLCQYVNGSAATALPVHQLLHRPVHEQKTIAAELAERLSPMLAASDISVELTPSIATIGGGALPGSEIPSYAVTVQGDKTLLHQLDLFFRQCRPAIVVGHDGGLLINVATLLSSQQIEQIVTATNQWCESLKSATTPTS